MNRRAAAILGVGLIAAVLVATAVGVAVGGGSPAGSSAGDSGRFRGSEPPAGIPMPDFALRNYDGRLVTARALRGRVIVLTFLDSQCTESCPLIASTVARTLDSLDGAESKDARAVAVTTDPREDTKRSVRRFLARNRAVGRLLYVGGGEDARRLDRVWRKFQVLSSLKSGHDTLHSAPVRIYDRRGLWVATLHAGADLTEENLAHDIREALTT